MRLVSVARDELGSIHLKRLLVALSDDPVEPLVAGLVELTLEHGREQPVEVVPHPVLADRLDRVPAMVSDHRNHRDLVEFIGQHFQPGSHRFQPVKQGS